ncbi:MAG: polymer-forming cytoskeletal protein [Coprobacillus sp.]
MNTEKKDSTKSKFFDRYFDNDTAVENESETGILNSKVEVESNGVYNEISVTKTPSVISSGTVIQGNLNADNDIEVYGQVIGNIVSTGVVKVDGGSITGDIKANKILVKRSVIQGNLDSESMIDVVDDTQVTGMISGLDIVLNCQCKGNIYAGERLRLLESSIVKGDIQTKTIKIEEGSRVEGKLKMIK